MSIHFEIKTDYRLDGIIGCRSIGLDVSPLCIDMAKEVTRAEDLSDDQCSFYMTDATINPDELLQGKKEQLNVMV
jgi:hypothetical protein